MVITPPPMAIDQTTGHPGEDRNDDRVAQLDVPGGIRERPSPASLRPSVGVSEKALIFKRCQPTDVIHRHHQRSTTAVTTSANQGLLVFGVDLARAMLRKPIRH